MQTRRHHLDNEVEFMGQRHRWDQFSKTNEWTDDFVVKCKQDNHYGGCPVLQKADRPLSEAEQHFGHFRNKIFDEFVRAQNSLVTR